MTFYIVSGIGVREARSTIPPDVLTRERGRRQQYKLEIFHTARAHVITATVSKAQWVDAALVFKNRDAAVDLYRRARKLAPKIGQGIWAAAIKLTNENSQLHPVWPGNQ